MIFQKAFILLTSQQRVDIIEFFNTQYLFTDFAAVNN